MFGWSKLLACRLENPKYKFQSRDQIPKPLQKKGKEEEEEANI